MYPPNPKQRVAPTNFYPHSHLLKKMSVKECKDVFKTSDTWWTNWFFPSFYAYFDEKRLYFSNTDEIALTRRI